MDSPFLSPFGGHPSLNEHYDAIMSDFKNAMEIHLLALDRAMDARTVTHAREQLDYIQSKFPPAAWHHLDTKAAIARQADFKAYTEGLVDKEYHHQLRALQPLEPTPANIKAEAYKAWVEQHVASYRETFLEQRTVQGRQYLETGYVHAMAEYEGETVNRWTRQLFGEESVKGLRLERSASPQQRAFAAYHQWSPPQLSHPDAFIGGVSEQPVLHNIDPAFLQVQQPGFAPQQEAPAPQASSVEPGPQIDEEYFEGLLNDPAPPVQCAEGIQDAQSQPVQFFDEQFAHVPPAQFSDQQSHFVGQGPAELTSPYYPHGQYMPEGIQDELSPSAQPSDGQFHFVGYGPGDLTPPGPQDRQYLKGIQGQQCPPAQSVNGQFAFQGHGPAEVTPPQHFPDGQNALPQFFPPTSDEGYTYPQNAYEGNPFPPYPSP
jgi:hypothetical protein